MTGILTRVLREHADATPTPAVDVDAIVRAGDRRVRRRRAGGGLLTVVVAGSVAAAAALVVDGTPDGRDDLAADAPGAFEQREVSYAVGTSIHTPEQVFDVGRPIASYVQTDDGFVYTQRNGVVWLFDGTSSDPLGRAEGNRLRADDTGSLVAWVEPGDVRHEYVVFDTAQREEVARVDDTGDPRGERAEVFAVDDGSVYWRYDNELVRYDVSSRRETVLATQQPPSDPATKAEPAVTDIVDVAYGTLAYTVEGVDDWGMSVGQRLDPAGDVLAQATNGFLSPDAGLLAAEENDNIAVYDTDSGANVTPDLGGYPFAVVYGWVDADTAMVFGLEDIGGSRDRYSADFLRCDVPSGSCEVASSADVHIASFALPIGDPMT